MLKRIEGKEYRLYAYILLNPEKEVIKMSKENKENAIPGKEEQQLLLSMAEELLTQEILTNIDYLAVRNQITLEHE